MRLIDADALEDQYCEDCGVKYGGAKCKCKEDCPVIATLHDTPTVDAVPVVHANVIFKGTGKAQCGNCNRWCVDWDYDTHDNFCCKCGAKLDGGEKNGNDT